MGMGVGYQWAASAALFIVSSFACLVWGQGVSQPLHGMSAPVVTEAVDLDLSPGDPLLSPGRTGGLPGGSGSLYLSDPLLRNNVDLAPNFQVGYLHRLGNGYALQNRLFLDYVFPVTFGNRDSVVFGEVRAVFTNFMESITTVVRTGNSLTLTSNFNHRADLSFGGGYRTIRSGNTLLGINAFFDAAKLNDRWYASGGIGLEFAALLPGEDAFDLTVNWYGNLFSPSEITEIFRTGPHNFDIQVGYSHEIFAGGPDLRLHITGYRFDIPRDVYGWRAGAEIRTRNRMFTAQYEAGRDWHMDMYHSVRVVLNLGLDLYALTQGRNPVTMPEPLFRSPRNFAESFTEPVKREYIDNGTLMETEYTSSSRVIIPTEPEKK